MNDNVAFFLELTSNHAKKKATSFPGAIGSSYTSKSLME